MKRLTCRAGLLAVLVLSISSCGDSPSTSEVEQLPLVDSSLAVGEPRQFEQGTHCGFRVLSRMINGQVWRAEGASDGDWFPGGWRTDSSTSDGRVAIRLVLAEDESTITASLNGTDVTYVAAGSEWQDSDLCA
ncbi:MAG: hypothetical protein ABJH68_12275 [Ilumatobacter sp.]|uniref:hypothetical protein n=1 Tax=Ilumatobacter sp. TaxID=1967498 RepID=UPI003299843E